MTTITGTSGNDALDGTSGADTIWGGDGNDTVTASAGADVIYGGKGSDTIVYPLSYSNYKVSVLYDSNSAPFTAGWGYQIQDLSGNGGTDYVSSDVEIVQYGDTELVTGTAGDKVIDGGDGTDVYAATGTISNFSVTKTSSGYVVVDKRGTDGTDTLLNFESIRFTDKTMNLTVQAKAALTETAVVTRLVELYVSFFNRIPDADGMSYWIDQMNAGQTTNQIAEAFYNAGINYSSLTGFSATMSNADFINVIYKNVLGRADGADAGGLAYWKASLESGAATRGSLVTDILNSAHTFKGDATWGWVADLLDNKNVVAKKFSIDLGLNFITPEESISQGMALASAVTSTDTSAAIALMGVTEANFTLS